MMQPSTSGSDLRLLAVSVLLLGMLVVFPGCVSLTSSLQTAARDDRDLAAIVSLSQSETTIREYGNAASNVRRYYRFWQDHFAGRTHVLRRRRAESFQQHAHRLRSNVDKWVSEEAFRKSGRFLHRAFEENLTLEASRKMQELVLQHDHAQLVYQTLRAEAESTTGKATSTTEKDEKALRKRLIEFRKTFSPFLRNDDATP